MCRKELIAVRFEFFNKRMHCKFQYLWCAHSIRDQKHSKKCFSIERKKQTIESRCNFFRLNTLGTLHPAHIWSGFNDWVKWQQRRDSHRDQLNQKVQQIVHFHWMIFVFNPQFSVLKWSHLMVFLSVKFRKLIFAYDIRSRNFIWLADIAIFLCCSVVTINNFLLWMRFTLAAWCSSVPMLDRFRWTIVSHFVCWFITHNKQNVDFYSIATVYLGKAIFSHQLHSFLFRC